MTDRKPVPKAIFVGHVPDEPTETSPVDEVAEAVRSTPPQIPAYQQRQITHPIPIKFIIDGSTAFTFGLFATIGAAVAVFVMFLALLIFLVISGRHIPS